MVEEKNGVQNGTPNGDMPPQENSPKTPLTGEEIPEAKPEIKSKDDTKVEIPAEEVSSEEFRGLTKEDLMKYSQDPFWKKLRIFLMLLFWAGWLAMLVIAILIIIQAPQCEPLPSLQWVQEAPILQVDVNSHGLVDITALMTSLSLTSFYFPSLISSMDYKIMDSINVNNVAEVIREATEVFTAQNIKSVTDYVPNPVHTNHPWVNNAQYPDLVVLEDDQYYLNYDSSNLAPQLQDVFEFWKSDLNVTGFLVPDSEVQNFTAVVNTTADLNSVLEPQEIAVSTSTVDMQAIINSLDTPGVFKEFIMQNVDDWHYYLFNPVGQQHLANTKERMSCVTLTLMTLPCTPVMQVSNLTAFEQDLGGLVRAGVDLRTNSAIKFGETQFVNTTENVIAFTRTRRGTPGYAVVVNLGTGTNVAETVDFSGLDYVPDSGEMVYSLAEETAEGDKVSLTSVEVAPHEGKVILFVAAY